tara:strand:- start:19 stop:288 length:270 start_codon:yes stop_codon:yes gene_type:complete
MSSNFSVAEPTVPLPNGLQETITAKQVAAWLGINRSTIYRYVEDGTFPKPVKLSPRRQVFIKEQVIKWFHDRQNSDNELPALPEADSEI